MIWGVLLTWIEDLTPMQKGLFIFASICFFLVFIRIFIAWWEKRNIENIPDFIEKLDVRVSNYIDDFELELSVDEWQGIYRDYSVILGIPLDNLIAILSKEHNRDILDREFESINRAYLKNLNPESKMAESLTYLGDMGGILDSYGVGLKALRDSAQYKKLYNKIKTLQRKAPSAYISAKINEYFTVSERLYILLLGIKPLYDRPELRDKLPVKVNAKKNQVRPIVEGQISNLIAGVREAILKHKERNSATYEQLTKPEFQNREQRRGKR